MHAKFVEPTYSLDHLLARTNSEDRVDPATFAKMSALGYHVENWGMGYLFVKHTGAITRSLSNDDHAISSDPHSAVWVSAISDNEGWGTCEGDAIARTLDDAVAACEALDDALIIDAIADFKQRYPDRA